MLIKSIPRNKQQQIWNKMLKYSVDIRLLKNSLQNKWLDFRKTVFKIIWVGPASFPSLSYINFGKIVLQSGKFQILFWRLEKSLKWQKVLHFVDPSMCWHINKCQNINNLHENKYTRETHWGTWEETDNNNTQNTRFLTMVKQRLVDADGF